MPRRPRIDYPGAIHHVWWRGARSAALYHDPFDFRMYLGVLGQTALGLSWKVHAYSLLSNHGHALIETPDASLPAGMKRIQEIYAMYYNERHQSSGCVFQGRFGSRPLEVPTSSISRSGTWR